MSSKTCFFIGHRNAPNSIKERLIEVVEQHIVEYDVKTFIVGHYGFFDSLVGEVLKGAKKQYKEIKIYLLAPYALDNKTEIPQGFDGTYYPNGMEIVPKRYAISQANRYMIQNSDYLIAYWRYIGNTRKFVEYAKNREKKGLIKITLL